MQESLHILVVSEYLPPYVSGIANRCKNLIRGYRELGHKVTVYGPESPHSDHTILSINNPFYDHQQMFIAPPLTLLLLLLNPFEKVPYDICHVFTPLAFPILPLLPLLYLRNVKIYVSYHVYLEFYRKMYFDEVGLGILGMLIEAVYVICYFLPLVWFAEVVGVPSKTADYCVFKYAKRIHYMRSGLDTTVFKPLNESENIDEFEISHEVQETPVSLLPLVPTCTTSTPLSLKDVLAVAGTCSDHFKLVYVGRLAVEKNIEFLIKAMTHPAMSRNTLILVGNGPHFSSLLTLACNTVGDEYVLSTECEGVWAGMKEGVSKFKIVFVGMVHSEKVIAEYYARSNCFVSASASETFGFTVAEALSCGTPSVMVRSGAFRSVYRMIDGWMFDEGIVDDYVGRVLRVCIDPNASKCSRRIGVKWFGVMGSVRDLIKAYHMCVKGEFWEEEGVKKI